MIPSDASLWAAQVQQAYDLADGNALVAPQGWNVVDQLVVTDQIALWKHTAPCGFILENDANEHAIIIRGTDSISDFLLDFQALLMPATIGVKIVMVERGFIEFFSAIQLMKNAQKLSAWIAACAPGKITFAGHSLGAAAASIGASYALAFGMFTRRVVFACPNTGSASLQGALMGLTANSAEIDNVRDIVPSEPPVEFGFAGYQPVEWVDSNSLGAAPISIEDRHALATYQKLLAT